MAGKKKQPAKAKSRPHQKLWYGHMNRGLKLAIDVERQRYWTARHMAAMLEKGDD